MVAIFVSPIIVGCSDDDDDPVVPVTVDSKLRGTWKMTGATIAPGLDTDGDGVVDLTDFYATFSACDKDDLIIFKTGYVVTFDEGALKCDPADPQESNGTWSLNSAKTVLTVIEGGDTTVLNIVSLTSTTFVGTMTQVDLPGQTMTMTLTKQ